MKAVVNIHDACWVSYVSNVWMDLIALGMMALREIKGIDCKLMNIWFRLL